MRTHRMPPCTSEGFWRRCDLESARCHRTVRSQLSPRLNFCVTPWRTARALAFVMQSAIIRIQRSVFETRIHVESGTGIPRKVIVYCGHRGTAHGGSLSDLWASPFTTALSDSMNTEPMSLHFDDTGTAFHATDGTGASRSLSARGAFWSEPSTHALAGAFLFLRVGGVDCGLELPAAGAEDCSRLPPAPGVGGAAAPSATAGPGRSWQHPSSRGNAVVWRAPAKSSSSHPSIGATYVRGHGAERKKPHWSPKGS